jgi:asparagine synthase (glutamine-hydrolysing)
LAIHVARREGLEAPIAATNVFPGDAQAAESEWQELLVRHVGVETWQRLSFGDEMDVVGPVAAPLLLHFGPTFPFNGHFGMPSMALAAGGSYLTGVGGDEVFDLNELTRLAYVLAGRIRPKWVDLKSIAQALAPEALRARQWKRLLTPEPWLRPEVQQSFMADLARNLARQHIWFNNQVAHDIWRERARMALTATLSAFGATVGTVVIHPFQEETFLRSVAARCGRTGWPSRAAALEELFGDVLPLEVAQRTSKATFDSVFFNQYSQAFVQRWDGGGVNEDLVDVDRLRSAWQAPEVDPRSLSLLQSAWRNEHHEG